MASKKLITPRGHSSLKVNLRSTGTSNLKTSCSKKVGLARLAKAKSLSGSVDGLFPDDKEFYEGKSPSLYTHHNFASSSNSVGPPEVVLTSDDKESAHPNPVSAASSLSKTVGLPLAKDVQSSDNVSIKVESSDEALSHSSTEGTALLYTDKHKVEVECNTFPHNSSLPSTPHLRKKQTLGVPRVKRSGSLSLLSGAIGQLHGLCLLPLPSKSEEEAQHRKGKAAMKSGDGFLSIEKQISSVSCQNLCDNTSSDSESSKLSGVHSISMDDLQSCGTYGLPLISTSDAKQKSYLFGGAPNLLGPSELDRCYPNRVISIFIATWNMNGKEPPMTLDDFLLPDTMESVPDIYVIGTQESGGDRSEWEIRLQATIGPTHVLFSSVMLGILQLVIFLRRDLIWFCSVPEDDSYSLRPGTYFKTKGCVAISFQLFGTKLLFMNTHLFAHEEKQHMRVQNYKVISHSVDLPKNLKVKHHKDVTKRFDCVFWLGDLNFRLAVNREHVLERVCRPHLDQTTIDHLIQWDQLTQAKLKGEAFVGFEEGRITFPPTFKFDPGTDEYDSSGKQRVPSYTDRILFKCQRNAVTCLTYNCCPLFKTSDHKPVCGLYQCKIRPGKDDVPLAAGLFNREVYLAGLKRRRKYYHQSNDPSCKLQ